MKRIGTAAVVMVAMALAACVGDDTGSREPTASSTSAPVLPSADPISPDQPPLGVIDEDTGEPYAPQSVPEWDDDSRTSVVTAAAAAMGAYSQPHLSFEDWWAGVLPLLDQKASMDYAYMDPARIVATEVIGPGVIVDDTSAYVATVDVPTDAGTYQVILSRLDAHAPWLVSRFVLPEGVN